jgi:hypothetical protein
MKNSILACLLIGMLTAFADDADNNILKNGDFSSGVNHWEGDCHTPDSASFDPSETAPTSGVVVKLRPADWTQVIQDFEGGIGRYNVSITYVPSPDLKFSDKPEDYNNIPGQLGYSALGQFSMLPGRWALLVNDLGAGHYWYWKIEPKLGGTNAQTLNLRVQLDSGAESDKGFILVFPPGQGYINLQKISMTPAAPGNPGDN